MVAAGQGAVSVPPELQAGVQDLLAAGQGELPVPPELQAGAEAEPPAADQGAAQGRRHAISAAVQVLDEAAEVASSSTVVEGCESDCDWQTWWAADAASRLLSFVNEEPWPSSQYDYLIGQ